MANAPIKTMGDLAQQTPEDDDERDVFLLILAAIHNNYPTGWEAWKVLDLTHRDLFGEELSPAMDKKLRFGIPTTDLVRSFYPSARDLPERAYRHIRKILLSWPLGRALIYSPHSIVEKLHAPSYKPFMDHIKELRYQGKLTNRETTSRMLSDEDRVSQRAASTPRSSKPCSKKTGGGDSKRGPGPKRHQTPIRGQGWFAFPEKKRH